MAGLRGLMVPPMGGHAMVARPTGSVLATTGSPNVIGGRISRDSSRVDESGAIVGLGRGREGESGDRQGGQGNSRACERHGWSSV